MTVAAPADHSNDGVHTITYRSTDAVGNVEADRTAIGTLLAAALAGQAQSLVYTSGIWVLGTTGDTPTFEDATTEHPAAVVAWRPAHEKMILAAASPHLATAVIRPGMVYGGPVVHRGRLYLATCNLAGEFANKPTAVVCIGEK